MVGTDGCTASVSSLAPTEIVLPDERHLVVREVGPDDGGALMALYDGLDAEDRHRRFFCSYRPPASWFEEMADVARRGGARVVAEHVSGTTRRIVAEAGYVTLPNGNGDLAMVVERAWRGWLGPYLLARLAAEAAQRGVPNLEADVLASNGPMLALLRRRGAVVVEHDGWSTVRVRIGTEGDVATWDGSADQRRVLVETPGGHWPSEDDARRAGLTVLTCPGPSPQHTCPVLDGRRCPLVDDADTVVVRYPVGDARWTDLIESHRHAHPGASMLLEQIGAAPVAVSDIVRQLPERGPSPASL